MNIVKYSDNEPLELCIALTRITVFPLTSCYCPYTPWWLIVFGVFTGLFQIWATTLRSLYRRNQANFISLLLPIMIIANIFVVGEISYRIFTMFVVVLICFWNFWKTSFQLSKRKYRR